MEKLKDSLALLATGLVCAGFIGFTFRYLGADVWMFIANILLLVATADNRRLRRRIRRMEEEAELPPTRSP